MTGQRCCYACREWLPLEDFASDASKACGRKGICRPCDSEKARRYYAANRERRRAAMVARSARIRAERAPRTCKVCAEPAISSRHHYCAACRPRPAKTTARGYGGAHQKERARWAPRVALGEVTCARCELPIAQGEPWDLTRAGPAHRSCARRRP